MTKKKVEPLDPRKYMQMAIDAMRKSIAEPRDDGKANPKVGAVLLFPDGKTVDAHRGELREGDHAEYTLLERKCADRKLDECILFATLEPCVKRNPPKRGCSRRVINARIKTVYVGIQDPDPTVAGDGIANMESHGIKVIMFDRDLQKVIEDENPEFLKQAHQRAKEAKEQVVTNPLKEGLPTTDVSSFSEPALQKFIDEAKLEFNVGDKAFEKYLTEMGVLQLDEGSQSLKPTGMGILLFGKNPRSRFPQAVVNAYIDYGADAVETKDFDQPLALIPDLIEEWFRKVLPTSKDTSGFKRKDIPDFPIEVLREAVINAIVHRDYSIEGARVAIEIDRDKIVIKSPGPPMPAISIEQLNGFKAPSLSRNPTIASVFTQMDYVEGKGFGMRALRSLQEKYNLPLPEYALVQPHLVLTLPRNMDALPKVSVHENLKKLSKKELKGYEFIKLEELVSRRQYQEYLGIESDKMAERQIKKMIDLDLIESVGAGRSMKYRVR